MVKNPVLRTAISLNLGAKEGFLVFLNDPLCIRICFYTSIEGLVPLKNPKEPSSQDPKT